MNPSLICWCQTPDIEVRKWNHIRFSFLALLVFIDTVFSFVFLISVEGSNPSISSCCCHQVCRSRKSDDLVFKKEWPRPSFSDRPSRAPYSSIISVGAYLRICPLLHLGVQQLRVSQNFNLISKLELGTPFCENKATVCHLLLPNSRTFFIFLNCPTMTNTALEKILVSEMTIFLTLLFQ